MHVCMENTVYCEANAEYCSNIETPTQELYFLYTQAKVVLYVLCCIYSSFLEWFSQVPELVRYSVTRLS